jgi:virginiamycin B lyase
VNKSFITTGGGAFGIALDGSFIYWTDTQAGSIVRANLDGTGANDSLVTVITQIVTTETRAVAVDANSIYWSTLDLNTFFGSIGSANLDGTAVNYGLIPRIKNIYDFTINGPYIYWAALSNIGRANLDGTGATDDFFSTGLPNIGSDVVSIAVDANHIYWSLRALVVVPASLGLVQEAA